jgi:hypothetical protein
METVRRARIAAWDDFFHLDIQRGDTMPLATKFRTLRDLKRKPDGQQYPLSEIAREASRLYREEKILRTAEELRASGASMADIERACEEIRGEPDVVNRLYLTELKDGAKRDVKWGVVQALSLFFEVETDFWRIGDAATEATRRAEQQVELIQLGVQAAKAIQKLDSSATDGDQESTQGMALMGALFRGVDGADPAQAEVILRAALLGLQAVQEDRPG